MTPNACSLYDEIKLRKLRDGYIPKITASDLWDKAGDLNELERNGWIKIINTKGSNTKEIRILK